MKKLKTSKKMKNKIKKFIFERFYLVDPIFGVLVIVVLWALFCLITNILLKHF